VRKQFYDPNNRKAEIDILQKLSKANRDDVEKTYDFFIRIDSVDHTGAVNQKGMSDLLSLLKMQGDIQGSTDLARFYDETHGSKVQD
jgi:hypothetical protein